ncbi:MAG: glycosyltransferase family 2 protein [Coriobacteriia bacterium]|nr:glycosyltransferase family 2 protein [Coriobacteriia bacterium]
MDFSLIVPCHNEAESLPAFYQAVRNTFDTAGLEYEIIFIDDGSQDGTLDTLKRLTAEDGTIKPAATIVSFSRNFGKEAGIYAGLQHATGTMLGIIDADMQQDPAISLDMLRFLQENPGFDCVAAVQEQRKENAVLRGFKSAFYKMFNRMGTIDIPENASDFRVFRNYVAEALLSMPENHRFSKGLFAWVGFRTHTITYRPNERLAGTTNWSFGGLMKYALGGIMSFSTKPLRMAMWMGGLVSVAAAIYLVVVVFETIFARNAQPGYPTLVCLILLFGGIQIFLMGIIGEYLGRTYIEGKHRPIYVAREVVQIGGLPESAAPAPAPESQN